MHSAPDKLKKVCRLPPYISTIIKRATVLLIYPKRSLTIHAKLRSVKWRLSSQIRTSCFIPCLERYYFFYKHTDNLEPFSVL